MFTTFVMIYIDNKFNQLYKSVTMENELRNTGSTLDHCRKCSGKLYEWEEQGSICGLCIENMIQDSKKDYKGK